MKLQTVPFARMLILSFADTGPFFI